MPKICFYIMVSDTGLAPNPFFGTCTLSVCTPNHMRARLDGGDLIVGCFRSGAPPKVVYVMKVAKWLTLDAYYRDPRFQKKKPSSNDWKAKVGDNMYFRNDNGVVQQDPLSICHTEASVQAKDIRGNKVFIGSEFLYLGRNAVLLEKKFLSCLPRSQGMKYLRSTNPLYDEFVTWYKTLGSGYKGHPRDRKIKGCVSIDR